MIAQFDGRITSGHITFNKKITEKKLTVGTKEFNNYVIENDTKSFTVTYNGEQSRFIDCIPSEKYTVVTNTPCQVRFFNSSGVELYRLEVSTKNGIEVQKEVTSPTLGTLFKVGFANQGEIKVNGAYLTKQTTSPDLKLVESNFDSKSLQVIHDGLGLNSGKTETEIYYDCTKYGVLVSNTDNTSEFQSLIDLVYSNGGGVIWIPKGTYLFDAETSGYDLTNNITTLLVAKSGVSINGESLDKTILKVVGESGNGTGLFCQNSTQAGEIMTGCTYQNFTVDMSEHSLVTYTHRGKAFYFSGIKDVVFRDLRLLSTPSTSLGIDMLDNVVMDSIYVYQGGRQWSYGGNGGAGIGIGTGKWKNENYIIRNCICDSCGHFGIFLEDQGIFSTTKDRNYPKGRIISNNVCRNGRHYGIGVRGGKNVIVSNNNIYENKGGLYTDYGAINVVFSGNLVQGSSENGFFYGNESISYPCENIVLMNNVFIENNVGIKTAIVPTNNKHVGNVFIGNSADES